MAKICWILFLEIKAVATAKIVKDQPVVFIHKWDWLARRAAKKMTKKGYINACCLVGGVKGFEKFIQEMENP